MAVRPDVVVVGGGVAGLVAARDLGRAGMSVLLLESSPEVGGKLRLGTRSAGCTSTSAPSRCWRDVPRPSDWSPSWASRWSTRLRDPPSSGPAARSGRCRAPCSACPSTSRRWPPPACCPTTGSSERGTRRSCRWARATCRSPSCSARGWATRSSTGSRSRCWAGCTPATPTICPRRRRLRRSWRCCVSTGRCWRPSRLCLRTRVTVPGVRRPGRWARAAAARARRDRRRGGPHLGDRPPRWSAPAVGFRLTVGSAREPEIVETDRRRARGARAAGRAAARRRRAGGVGGAAARRVRLDGGDHARRARRSTSATPPASWCRRWTAGGSRRRRTPSTSGAGSARPPTCASCAPRSGGTARRRRSRPPTTSWSRTSSPTSPWRRARRSGRSTRTSSAGAVPCRSTPWAISTGSRGSAPRSTPYRGWRCAGRRTTASASRP